MIYIHCKLQAVDINISDVTMSTTNENKKGLHFCGCSYIVLNRYPVHGHYFYL